MAVGQPVGIPGMRGSSVASGVGMRGMTRAVVGSGAGVLCTGGSSRGLEAASRLAPRSRSTNGAAAGLSVGGGVAVRGGVGLGVAEGVGVGLAVGGLARRGSIFSWMPVHTRSVTCLMG